MKLYAGYVRYRYLGSEVDMKSGKFIPSVIRSAVLIASFLEDAMQVARQSVIEELPGEMFIDAILMEVPLEIVEWIVGHGVE